MQDDYSTIGNVSLRELLQPIHNDNNSVEYKNHYQAVVNFVQRLRSLETNYAEVYEKILSLEKKMSASKHNVSVK
jgi:hypothetical protein